MSESRTVAREARTKNVERREGPHLGAHPPLQPAAGRDVLAEAREQTRRVVVVVVVHRVEELHGEDELACSWHIGPVSSAKRLEHGSFRKVAVATGGRYTRRREDSRQITIT